MLGLNFEVVGVITLTGEHFEAPHSSLLSCVDAPNKGGNRVKPAFLRTTLRCDDKNLYVFVMVFKLDGLKKDRWITKGRYYEHVWAYIVLLVQFDECPIKVPLIRLTVTVIVRHNSACRLPVSPFVVFRRSRWHFALLI